MRVYTGALSTALTINAAAGVVYLSVMVQSGTCTFLGNIQFNPDPTTITGILNPTAVTFNPGQGVTLTGIAGSALDGITITPAAASIVSVIILF
jgi:hypothetical protein